jgi:hypothetical protein
LEALV